MRKAYRDSVVFTVVIGLLSAVGAVVMTAVVLLSAAPDRLVLPTLLAMLPVAPLVGCYLWLDRYEPEPRSLLAAGFGWGAVVATSLALLVQVVFAGPNADAVQLATVVAPVSEEATKGLFLLLLLWWRRHELDGILDGIVYAGMVGIGFAFTENILYLSAAYAGTEEIPGVTPAQALTGTFIMRCLLSPFAHPFFTAFIGIGLGVAISSRSAAPKVIFPVLGYLAAVIAHSIWNTAAFSTDGGFIAVYGSLMVPAFVMLVIFALWRRRSERRMLTAALQDAAQRGLLPYSDIDWLVSLRGRKDARAYAKHMGGNQGLAAMREYQQAAIELGFLHHRYLRGTPPPRFSERGYSYVARMNAVRPTIAFPGQVVPAR